MQVDNTRRCSSFINNHSKDMIKITTGYVNPSSVFKAIMDLNAIKSRGFQTVWSQHPHVWLMYD